MPRTYSQREYNDLFELLLRSSARYTALYDKWQAAETELTTMKARTKAAVQTFQTFAAPADLLQQVVEEQKRRGQR